MSIRTKILAGFGLSFLILGIIGFQLINVVESTASRFDDLTQRYLPLNTTLKEINISALEMLASTIEVVLLYNVDAEADEIEEEQEQLTEAIERLNESVADYEQYVLTSFPQEQPYLNDIQSIKTEFLALSEQIVILAEENAEEEELEEIKEEFEDVERDLLAVLNEVTALQTAELNRLNDGLQNTYQTTLNLYGVISFMVFVIFSSIAVVIARSVSQPIVRLKEIALRLAQGDYSQRAAVTTRDEIGVLAHNFNAMAAAIEERDEQLKQQLEAVQKARDEAEKSNQVKSAFLASMSHELRTPLNSIINYSKFVARGVMGPVNDRQEETVNKVVASGQHLLNLINDVLDMSKIESGSLNLFIEDNIDLNEVLANVVHHAQSLLIEKPEVNLQSDIQADLPLMRADRKRLTQIFLNIVSNACKFTEEGHVKIAARLQDNTLLFSVQDTGPGIEQADYATVFEAFKQTSTGLRQGEGTGLGLPISKNLAEAHGGKLWFESTVGQGTTFYVSLPVHSPDLVPTS